MRLTGRPWNMRPWGTPTLKKSKRVYPPVSLLVDFTPAFLETPSLNKSRPWPAPHMQPQNPPRPSPGARPLCMTVIPSAFGPQRAGTLVPGDFSQREIENEMTQTNPSKVLWSDSEDRVKFLRQTWRTLWKLKLTQAHKAIMSSHRGSVFMETACHSISGPCGA